MADGFPQVRASPGAVVAYVLVQAGLCLTLALSALWPGAAGDKELVSSVLQVLAAAGASGALLWVAGRSAGMRRTWRLAAAATALWGAGQSWVTAELALRGVSVRPSVADVLFLGAVVCAVSAALAFPSLPQGGRRRWRLVIDGSLIAGSVLLLVLYRLGDRLAASDEPWLLSLGYPVADSLIITVLLIAAMRAPRRLLPCLGTAVLGLLALSTANLEVFRLALEGRAVLDHPVNAGFALGLALVGLGGLLDPGPEAQGDEAAGDALVERGQRLLPYLFLPLVLAVLVASGDPPRGVRLGLLVFLAGMLLVRQVLVVEENAALAADMVRRARGYEALVQGSTELVLVVSRRRGRIFYASPSVTKALGESPPADVTLLDLVAADDRQQLVHAMETSNQEGGSACVFRVSGAAGPMVLEARLTDRSVDPAVQGVVVNARDVTLQALAQAALEESEQRYRRIVETAQEGIWVTDAHGITRFMNARAADMLHLPHDGLVGQKTTDILMPLLDEQGQETLRQRMAERRLGKVAAYDFSFRRPDGEQLHTHITASPLFDADGNFDGSLTMITDITARVVAEDQLRQDARTDPLTGLANRSFLSERVAEALAGLDPACPPALVYCDLDGFKTINDAWGHGAGDELLRQVADRLLQLQTPDITIGRLGGDEFAVLLRATTRAEVDDLTHRLMVSVRAPYSVAGRDHHIDLSVGIAIAQQGDQVESLLRNADLAMYQAKTDGRGRYRHYVPAMHERVAARIVLEQDLRQALEHEQLRLHYQPVIALATGECVGAEALLRWHHPTLGEVGPDVFLPAAEVSDLILRIGAWVLRRALADAAEWPDGRKPRVVSVNVAPQQLMDSRHVADLEVLLRSSPLPPGQVLLEVTEHTLLAGEGASQALRRLSGTGARLALDDFGTGYSSIAHLRDHPIDVLKLDRSYVSQVASESSGSRLALAILDMSRQLGISCTAEGIESAAQARLLSAAGCDHAQGYLYAAAMPQAELLRWLPRHDSELLAGQQLGSA